jgi:hypothetical protein
VEGFADVCCRDEEGVVEGVASEGVVLEGIASEGIVLEGVASEGVTCHKDGEGEQRREEVIASLIVTKLEL